MTAETILPTDVAILDLLRKRETMTVAELSSALDVTATAVRQRLSRLLAQGYLQRSATKAGRGRPSHHYALSSKGRRKTGANFADLAVALWQEIRAIRDPEVRRGLLQRLAQRLAVQYADDVQGSSLEERMESVARLFNERRVPFAVDRSGELPVLTALACPYPELAEQDRSICSLERLLFNEVLGANVRLTNCRLDGASCCTFESS
ncbi:MAG: winged helix-turn-helix transcriptional regulator [Pirellulaceae bacterium]|nr:winged helix-turn-helix transcriptional regulator [Pirellulaceae bacterium]